jgi:hypothetical protein
MLRRHTLLLCLNSDFMRNATESGLAGHLASHDKFRRAHKRALSQQRFRGYSKTQSEDPFVRESTLRERKLEHVESQEARKSLGVKND